MNVNINETVIIYKMFDIYLYIQNTAIVRLVIYKFIYMQLLNTNRAKNSWCRTHKSAL